MQPFEHAWRLLKNYDPTNPLAGFDPEASAVNTAARYGQQAGGTQENLNVMAQHMGDNVNHAAGDQKIPYEDKASDLQDTYHREDSDRFEQERQRQQKYDEWIEEEERLGNIPDAGDDANAPFLPGPPPQGYHPDHS